MLLNKAWGGKGGESCLKSGDRVALVYPNSDPINFLCAFYGCMFAGIVPVPIEVPLTRRVRNLNNSFSVQEVFNKQGSRSFTNHEHRNG